MVTAAGLAVGVGAHGQGETPWHFDGRPAGPVKQRPVCVAPDASVPEVRLGELDEGPIRREDAERAKDLPVRYGVGREVRVSRSEGRWFSQRDGSWVWAVDVVSAGALGLRVRLSEMRLARGASVIVYSPDERGDVAGPYEESGPFGTGEVWSPTRKGDRVRVEYRCAAPGEVPFQVDGVQHIYRGPGGAGGGGADQSCFSDVSCFASWTETARACVGIGFINQNSFFCSGQLLNTAASDETPYLLTANQCVSTQGVAQTCEVYFDYRSFGCGGSGPEITSLPRALGCSVVFTNGWSNSSLLMVDGALPPGRAWAGWSSGPVANAAPVASIHFPQNEPARISFGVKEASACGGTGHIRGVWGTGPTGQGSAGGGLFLDDAQKLLVGVMSCGSSACGMPGANDFGSFSSFYPMVSGLVAQGSDDGFEPNDACRDAVGVSQGMWNSLVVKSVSEDWYTAVVQPGATFSFEASFTHANGDIDLELYTGCQGQPIAASTGQNNVESVSWTNATEFPLAFKVRVYLASDTRNTYSMTVSNGVPPGQGACCLPTQTCSVKTPSACTGLGGVYAGDSRTCEQACAFYSYTGPLVGIADGSAGCGTASVCSVDIPDAFRVAGVSAGVRIVHPYQGDLKFSLKHVATGRTVWLVDRPGVPQTSFGFPSDNYGASASNLFVSLDAAAQRYDLPVVGMDNVAGPWRPESPLSAFNDEQAQGVWQLVAQDCAAGETGSIVSFRLTLAKAVEACYANCDGSTLQPVLTANDFICFVGNYAAASTLANCDGSTSAPLLTANDFQCFINAFAAGCS